MTGLASARKVVRGGDAAKTAEDSVRLSYEDRFLRRRVLQGAGGLRVLVDLARATSLEAGDMLVLGDGRALRVEAAREPLLEVRGDDLARLAWHIGNRHTPCQIAPDRLLIQRDHVMADMLARLGARLAEVEEPFTPEGGAYGHGRTHGHDHGARHGPEVADGGGHGHGHGAGQDHGHGH